MLGPALCGCEWLGGEGSWRPRLVRVRVGEIIKIERAVDRDVPTVLPAVIVLYHAQDALEAVASLGLVVCFDMGGRPWEEGLPLVGPSYHSPARPATSREKRSMHGRASIRRRVHRIPQHRRRARGVPCAEEILCGEEAAWWRSVDDTSGLHRAAKHSTVLGGHHAGEQIMVKVTLLLWRGMLQHDRSFFSFFRDLREACCSCCSCCWREGWRW